MCDNCSAIQLAKNSVFHEKSKYIDVRFHFLRDLVNDGVVELSYCNSQDQIADIMTKPKKLEQFEKLCGMLGVVEVAKENEEVSISEDPDIPIKALVKEVVTRFGYTVTYRRAWTAKQIAMSQIYGDWEGSYKELPRWLNAVQYYAPGFSFCKPILQVDGTFLTGKYAGTLLIASSQDGNRRIFPVAFAIVEGETREAWEWFFYNLRTNVTPQSNICIISYRGTGLLGALRTELPQWCDGQSVYCIRHVASNFNKEFRDNDLKEKLIEMGYELMRPRFERMLAVLRQKNSRATARLDKIPKEKWTQSYDDGRRYGHMTMNLAECVNEILKGARFLPITTLVRATYHRLNSWFVHHRNEATNMIRAGHV
ncbi:PREDICTED: uncharacterized protein LOC109347050 [Lupinus angustifolius]|uniref:uncharacterized protein LOC109347050 n=1 Tax=Lupinus angustifolius TaxID=3871 RepID=UPI00092E2E2E|nr:PREDICTED: uncharacterized protein LOC109347050 [Lupinus angustifolius]